MAGKNRKEGLIESYTHVSGRVGVLVEVLTKTDFAARTPFFKELTHNLAMQVAAMGEKELLVQVYIKNPEITINELLTLAKKKLGEAVTIGRIKRYVL